MTTGSKHTVVTCDGLQENLCRYFSPSRSRNFQVERNDRATVSIHLLVGEACRSTHCLIHILYAHIGYSNRHLWHTQTVVYAMNQYSRSYMAISGRSSSGHHQMPGIWYKADTKWFLSFQLEARLACVRMPSFKLNLKFVPGEGALECQVSRWHQQGPNMVITGGSTGH